MFSTVAGEGMKEDRRPAEFPITANGPDEFFEHKENITDIKSTDERIINRCTVLPFVVYCGLELGMELLVTLVKQTYD